MKFCWVTLPVKNYEESLEFYTSIIKLRVDSEMIAPGVKMAMLGEEDQPKVEIIELDGNVSPSPITIAFEVESLDKTTEYLIENHIEIIRGPISPAPNVKFIFINDPNGYEVQLVENI